jgi:hypothetical protein
MQFWGGQQQTLEEVGNTPSQRRYGFSEEVGQMNIFCGSQQTFSEKVGQMQMFWGIIAKLLRGGGADENFLWITANLLRA